NAGAALLRFFDCASFYDSLCRFLRGHAVHTNGCRPLRGMPRPLSGCCCHQVIPESEWRPGRPALGCEVERRGMFLSHYNSVGVHGVTGAAAQQRIVDNLTEYYRRAHTHPVRVMFYEKESWTVRQGRNGATFGTGTPSKLIRVVNIG